MRITPDCWWEPRTSAHSRNHRRVAHQSSIAFPFALAHPEISQDRRRRLADEIVIIDAFEISGRAAAREERVGIAAKRGQARPQFGLLHAADGANQALARAVEQIFEPTQRGTLVDQDHEGFALLHHRGEEDILAARPAFLQRGRGDHEGGIIGPPVAVRPGGEFAHLDRQPLAGVEALDIGRVIAGELALVVIAELKDDGFQLGGRGEAEHKQTSGRQRPDRGRQCAIDAAVCALNGAPAIVLHRRSNQAKRAPPTASAGITASSSAVMIHRVRSLPTTR